MRTGVEVTKVSGIGWPTQHGVKVVKVPIALWAGALYGVIEWLGINKQHFN
jgi:hypothetical protein